MKRHPLLAPLLAAALAAPAAAHDTWLLAQQPKALPGSAARLDLTSGMAFPTLDYAIRPERVAVALCRLGGATTKIGGRTRGPKSLRFSARLLKAGVAVLWVELKPKSLELTPEKVREYFDEIGASEALRRSWAERGEKAVWREVYTKHAKTFIRVGPAGDTTADRSWSTPVGMRLEIVPERDPTALKAGDELPVLLLKDGKPLAGLAVGLAREGDAKGVLQPTDAAGRVRLRLDRAGRWLVRTTDLRPTAEGGWESDFSTLTLAVP